MILISEAQEGRPLLRMSVSEPPHAGYPSTGIYTRAAVVYAGSRHVDLAELFLAFLASDDYNQLIVHDGDALPPIREFTRRREFTHPPDHPDEWGLHERFSDAAETIAIAPDFSPFIVPATSARIFNGEVDRFMVNRQDAASAGRQIALLVNLEIGRNLAEAPRLRPEFDRRVELQRQINQRRAAGQPVPAAWISNPFHLRYYADQGWLEE